MTDIQALPLASASPIIEALDLSLRPKNVWFRGVCRLFAGMLPFGCRYRRADPDPKR